MKTMMAALLATCALSGMAKAQMIGSYDNFDVFNDTGKTAEGFEIDIEDVKPSDITRIFPDNFPVGQPYIRYSTPDRFALQPVTFPDGHTGVSIIYAARYVGGAWQSGWGDTVMAGTNVKLGNGTPYVAKPTLTTGESCWTQGQGAAYPTSGCDHFGISLAGGVTPGLMTMHWLLPNAAKPGTLIQAGAVASLPPAPVLTPAPVVPAKPPAVHVVAEAPEQKQYENAGLCSDAYWLKTYMSYSPKQADLNQLQKNLVPMKGPKVAIAWKLLQRCPPSVDVDKAEAEDDAVPKGNIQLVKRHEYYRYAGAYDSNHEVVCGGDASCDVPLKGANGKNELGGFVGAHNVAYDLK